MTTKGKIWQSAPNGRSQQAWAKLALKGSASSVQDAGEPLSTEPGTAQLKRPSCWDATKTFLQSPKVDAFIGLVTITNLILVVVETDRRAGCKQLAAASDTCNAEPIWNTVLNAVFLAIYSMDVLVRMVFFGWRYWTKNVWDFCDAFVVFLGILGELLNSVVSYSIVLKMLRLTRLVRLIHVLSMLRELYVIIHGLANTFKAVIWATVMLFILLALLSVLAVEFLHDIALEIASTTNLFEGCDRCAVAFGSWFDSLVTLFVTLVLGEDWNPLVLGLYAAQPWTIIAFIVCFLLISLGVMNLVLAVIVDAAAEARDNDVKHQADMKTHDKQKASLRFQALCSQMDADRDGTISWPELVEAFENNEDFRSSMMVLDVNKEDLDCVFRLMDADQSGDVSFAEFSDLLLRMKTQDSRTILLFIKYYVLELRQSQSYELRLIQDHVMDSLDRQTALLELHSKLLLSGDSPRAANLIGELQEMQQKAPAISKGVLRIVVCAAHNLKNTDSGLLRRDISDPYVIVRMTPTLCHTTHVIDQDLNPVWNYACSFPVDRSDKDLNFRVMDKDTGKDDLLGSLRVDFRKLDLSVPKRIRMSLEDGGGGELEFELHFIPDAPLSAAAATDSTATKSVASPTLPGEVPTPDGDSAKLQLDSASKGRSYSNEPRGGTLQNLEKRLKQRTEASTSRSSEFKQILDMLGTIADRLDRARPASSLSQQNTRKTLDGD